MLQRGRVTERWKVRKNACQCGEGPLLTLDHFLICPSHKANRDTVCNRLKVRCLAQLIDNCKNADWRDFSHLKEVSAQLSDFQWEAKEFFHPHIAHLPQAALLRRERARI